MPRLVPPEKRRRKVAVKPIKRAGRPSVYDPEYHPHHAFKFCLLGCTDEELARSFDISESTVALWKNEHEAFMNSIIAGRDQADANVAYSLYHRATGYSHTAEKVQWTKDGEELRADYVERFPPDTASAIFWLKNRRRLQWRDTPLVAVGVQANGGDVTVNMQPAELSHGYMQLIEDSSE